MKKEQNSKTAFGIFSFFTGVGFLDLGFEDAVFVPMMANKTASIRRYNKEQDGLTSHFSTIHSILHCH